MQQLTSNQVELVAGGFGFNFFKNILRAKFIDASKTNVAAIPSAELNASKAVGGAGMTELGLFDPSKTGTAAIPKAEWDPSKAVGGPGMTEIK